MSNLTPILCGGTAARLPAGLLGHGRGRWVLAFPVGGGGVGDDRGGDELF
jgi:hypothetical protein